MKYLAIIVVLCSQAWAGNWYVRKGAVGTNTGTNWTNAWNELSQVNFTTVACGDTVWIAGGTYTTNLSINKTCTSPSQLTINRVLSTDAVPVAAAGWSSAFDSQVVLQNAEVIFAGGAFYTVDGRVGDATQNNYTFGIKCVATGASGGECWDGAGTGTLNHVTARHIEMFGPPCVDSGTCSAGADGFNIAPTTNAVTNITLEYSWLHRWSESIRCALWNGSLIQYNDIDDTAQTTDEHEDVIFSFDHTNLTFRYNKVYLSPNDGIFFDGNCTNCVFYGNAYWASGAALITFFTGFTVSTTIINNTFSSDHVNGDFLCPGNCPWMYFQSTPNSSSIIKNNIFDHIVFSGSAGTGAIDYNAYSADSGKQDTGTHSFTYTSSYTANTQFVNVSPSTPSAGNYHLTTVGAGNGLATFQGKADTTVGSQFLTDMDGNVCSTNCNVGAFQPVGAAPAVSLSPASVNCGNSQTGALVACTAVTLTNTGTATLNIASIAVGGTNAGDFSEVSDCGATVAAGLNCTITPSFTPTVGGARAASISITDDAAGSPQTIALSGNGGIPVASLTPSSLAFGGINISNSSASQALILQNTGTAVMSITSISLTGANTGDFFQSNNCPVGSNLGNGASCTITVTFTPLAVGARSASVSVADGASGSPHASTLSGTGVQPAIAARINSGVRLSGRVVIK